MESIGTSSRPVPFDYTAFDGDPTLFVGMRIYDNGNPSNPVQVPIPDGINNVIPMPSLGDGAYQGFFTPTIGRSYFVKKNVFTDGTYTAVDLNRPGGSETFDTLPSIVDTIEETLTLRADIQATQREVRVGIQVAQPQLMVMLEQP